MAVEWKRVLTVERMRTDKIDGVSCRSVYNPHQPSPPSPALTTHHHPDNNYPWSAIRKRRMRQESAEQTGRKSSRRTELYAAPVASEVTVWRRVIECQGDDVWKGSRGILPLTGFSDVAFRLVWSTLFHRQMVARNAQKYKKTEYVRLSVCYMGPWWTK